MDDLIFNNKYRNIFLVEDRNYWGCCPFEYKRDRDLVLTYDFALRNQILSEGGKSGYFDSILEPDVLEEYNFDVYRFFSSWFKDKEGRDIFSYKGIDFGNAFRLELWNEIINSVRVCLSLLAVRSLQHRNLYVGLNNRNTLFFMDRLQIKNTSWNIAAVTRRENAYYFPISKWLSERTGKRGLGIKELVKSVAATVVDVLTDLSIYSLRNGIEYNYIFALKYHPTQGIIESLKGRKNIRLVSTGYSGLCISGKERRLPVGRANFRHKSIASGLMLSFEKKKSQSLKVEGLEISTLLYEIISKIITRVLPGYISGIDEASEFFKDKKLNLMLTVSNIGAANGILCGYCKINNIPRYLVINGMLGNSFLDESKDATFINSYSESIKKNYFRGMDNVLALGDPRMDQYVNSGFKKKVDCREPVILIGAAGFSPMNLISYAAFEFDFLNDILIAVRQLKSEGRKMKLVLKVRSNGYIGQYRSFLSEYFNDLDIKLFDSQPFERVIRMADFYVTTYSQTCIEASVLGIPVLYYKKDKEFSHPPFDGRSELVSASDPSELKEKINAFYDGSGIFEEFKKFSVLEKYIGPLDGKNIERNLNFIFSLMTNEKTEAAHKR
ncbi:MAG: hypothetical protein FJZ15_01930 [Candidatus Omnitrophica bacterium]|nr:hypothetical protein [Candidatus Omnitrophota bacterium]